MKVYGRWAGWGVGDIDPKVAELKAFMRAKFASYAGHLDGTDVFDQATEAVVRQMQSRYGLPVTGIIDYRTQVRMGFIKPVVPPARYPIQGVGHNTNAFLMGDPFHTFVQATDEGATEALRLYREIAGRDIVVLGYSMGGVTAQKFLTRLPVEFRGNVRALVTFGDPSMPASGSLLGDDPGEGISRLPQPEWVRDRYWSFSLDGDWYPRARGLLFLLYEVLTRMALTWEFATYLVSVFPRRAMQELMGVAASSDPLAGVLAGLGRAMSTGGPAVVGAPLDVGALFALLPTLVDLLFDAVRFVASGAHGRYGDPGFALWDGMTGVDRAVALIRERVPSATLFLFPGTWALWNQGFQFDVALRLQ